MRVKTCISGSSSQSFVILEWNVSSSSRIFVSFSQSKIYDVNNMLLFLDTNKKVIWFDISMQETILMHEFDPL